MINSLLGQGSKLTHIREDKASKLGVRGPVQSARFGTFHGIDPVLAIYSKPTITKPSSNRQAIMLIMMLNVSAIHPNLVSHPQMLLMLVNV